MVRLLFIYSFIHPVIHLLIHSSFDDKKLTFQASLPGSTNCDQVRLTVQVRESTEERRKYKFQICSHVDIFIIITIIIIVIIIVFDYYYVEIRNNIVIQMFYHNN